MSIRIGYPPYKLSLSNSERDAITNPVDGMEIYNTDSKEIQVYSAIESGWYCSKKAFLVGGSGDNIVISGDANNPSYITGITLEQSVGLEITDIATGTVRNTMGRNIDSLTGTVSFHPVETGGGQARLLFISERSMDGVNWTANDRILREVDVPVNSHSFSTKVSLIGGLQDGEYFRFRIVELGQGGAELQITQETILGVLCTTPSFVWDLSEDGTIIPHPAQ